MTMLDQGQWNIHSIFHSSCRIFIECAIGELVMQWVIFWQKIAFSTRKVGRIVQAAMLLHNFTKVNGRYIQFFIVVAEYLLSVQLVSLLCNGLSFGRKLLSAQGK